MSHSESVGKIFQRHLGDSLEFVVEDSGSPELNYLYRADDTASPTYNSLIEHFRTGESATSAARPDQQGSVETGENHTVVDFLDVRLVEQDGDERGDRSRWTVVIFNIDGKQLIVGSSAIVVGRMSRIINEITAYCHENGIGLMTLSSPARTAE